MTDGYGFYTPNFYPASSGLEYESNDVIAPLDSLRDQVSILGNLTHLNGHGSMKLVAAGPSSSVGFGDSLDQAAARQLSVRTPIESLMLTTRPQATGGSYRNRLRALQD